MNLSSKLDFAENIEVKRSIKFDMNLVQSD